MTKHIIYLAAGNSRRFGENKLLFELNGKPVYRYCLDKLITLKEKAQITVVSVYDEILEYADKNGLRGVYATDSEKGISYSIKSALNAVGEFSDEDYVMFIVADQPYLSVKTVESVLEKADGTNKLISVICNGIAGNPTMFSAEYIPELFNLEGDKGGRIIINRYIDKCVWVEVCDETELVDIDVKKNLVI